MEHVGTIRTIQVGTARQYESPGQNGEMGRTWTTSFFRTPDPRPRWLYSTHLEGNAQADTKNHGRPEQAILLYAAQHYSLWHEELGRHDMGPGAFAENLTVDGLSEESVCAGDLYAAGEARIRVSGPRYPCAKIERRWGIEGLTAQVARTGRTGWYCGVVQEGLLAPNLEVFLAERQYPRWTMALINDFGHGRNRDRELGQALAACPLLNPWWQQLILHKLGLADAP
jgi:MOSC domain-containing protein YiiM